MDKIADIDSMLNVIMIVGFILFIVVYYQIDKDSKKEGNEESTKVRFTRVKWALNYVKDFALKVKGK